MIRAAIFAGLLLLAGCASRPPAALQFAVIGDLQYNAFEERAFPHLIDALNREPLAFVVHLGDFKAGSNARCTDELFASRKADFERSQHPFVYLTGDNEWVDCRRKSNHADDPLERLAALRRIFFVDDLSLGARRMPLERQSAAGGEFAAYRENTLWTAGGVVFAALNIQGSFDNAGFDPASDAEQAVRTRANIAWMRSAFRRAYDTRALGVVLFQQANPGFETDSEDGRQAAFRPYLEAFEEEARRSGLPVLFVHGDTHTFRNESPYLSPLDKRAIANVTRVEGHGTPHVDWIRIRIDPTNKVSPFAVESAGFVPPAELK
jgi:hypothetical protein